MVWHMDSAQALEALEGVYSLPGNCWAVLTINRSPPKNQVEAEAYPEGYAYTWGILAPGEPPSLRGRRMAGVDNSDDKHVRAQTKLNPQQGTHRAHRHLPNWKEIVSVCGQDWPTAGNGVQLPAPPASPEEFWVLCMDCLRQTLSQLGLEMPDEKQLFETHVTEKQFREMQRNLRNAEPQSGLAM